MIEAAAPPDFPGLIAALERRAKAIAEARAESARLARTAPEQAWRRAALLWPLFVKG